MLGTAAVHKAVPAPVIFIVAAQPATTAPATIPVPAPPKMALGAAALVTPLPPPVMLLLAAKEGRQEREGIR